MSLVYLPEDRMHCAGGGLKVSALQPQSKASIIVAAPDGAPLFTRKGNDRIDRIAVDGELREIELEL